MGAEGSAEAPFLSSSACLPGALPAVPKLLPEHFSSSGPEAVHLSAPRRKAVGSQSLAGGGWWVWPGTSLQGPPRFPVHLLQEIDLWLKLPYHVSSSCASPAVLLQLCFRHLSWRSSGQSERLWPQLIFAFLPLQPPEPTLEIAPLCLHCSPPSAASLALPILYSALSHRPPLPVPSFH